MVFGIFLEWAAVIFECVASIVPVVEFPDDVAFFSKIQTDALHDMSGHVKIAFAPESVLVNPLQHLGDAEIAAVFFYHVGVGVDGVSFAQVLIKLSPGFPGEIFDGRTHDKPFDLLFIADNKGQGFRIIEIFFNGIAIEAGVVPEVVYQGFGDSHDGAVFRLTQVLDQFDGNPVGRGSQHPALGLGQGNFKQVAGLLIHT